MNPTRRSFLRTALLAPLGAVPLPAAQPKLIAGFDPAYPDGGDKSAVVFGEAVAGGRIMRADGTVWTHEVFHGRLGPMVLLGLWDGKSSDLGFIPV